MVLQRFFLTGFTIISLFSFTGRATAAAREWVGGVSTWDVNANWNPSGVPQPGQYVTIAQPGAVVTYQNPTTIAGSVATMTLSGTGAGVTLNQSKQNLAPENLLVGYDAKGVFNQSGGSNAIVSNLRIGTQPGGDGTYNLTGTGILTAGEAYVGYGGKGAFNQGPGTSFKTTSGLYVGYNVGATGVYTMTGGTLEADGLAVGSSGSGQFKQSGGTVTLPSLSVNGGSEYQLSGAGQLNVQNISVGNGGVGTGTFTQSGGTVNTAGLQVGSNRTGVYSLSGGSLTVPVTSVGTYAGVKGTMNQSGGTHTFTNTLYVGNDTDAPGTSVYTLSGGTLAGANASVWVKASGRIVQTGGTLKVNIVALEPHATMTVSGGTFENADGSMQMDETTSTLDLTNRSMFINYTGGTPVGSMRKYIAHAYNGGAWNGTGLTSSTAAANADGALGYGEAKDVLGISGNQTAIWHGYQTDASAVLVMYTVRGDTNLDGVVDFNDLVRLAQHYNVSDGFRLWSEGDVNYDGNVDFNDLVTIAQHYGAAVPAQGVDFGGSFGSDVAAAFASVPEPASGVVVAGAMLSMLGRRGHSPRVRPSAGR